TRILNHRPDLVPEVVPLSKKQPLEPGIVFPDLSGLGRSAWKDFLSDVLGGWIIRWLNPPEFGFWHEETPESITKTSEEEVRRKKRAAGTKPSGRCLLNDWSNQSQKRGRASQGSSLKSCVDEVNHPLLDGNEERAGLGNRRSF